MTQDPDERAKLSTARMVASSITILLIAVVVSPQIHRAGDLQGILTIITVAFGVVGLALYLCTFFTSREAVRHHAGKVNPSETLAMMRRNKPLVVLCASTLLCLSGMFSLQTVGVYYARDVLNDTNLYIVLTVVQNVGVLGIGFGLTNTLIFAFQADTVDYGEWRTGVRAEGSSYAVLSFTRKAGQGVGGALAAYTIGIGGYISGSHTQTDAAVTSIRVAAGAVPAALVLAAVAVMLAYPLTERAFRALVAEMAQRRVAETVATLDTADPVDRAVDPDPDDGPGTTADRSAGR